MGRIESFDPQAQRLLQAFGEIPEEDFDRIALIAISQAKDFGFLRQIGSASEIHELRTDLQIAKSGLNAALEGRMRKAENKAEKLADREFDREEREEERLTEEYLFERWLLRKDD